MTHQSYPIFIRNREENECLEEIATICAMLSVENIYFYPKRYRTDQQKMEEQNLNSKYRGSRGNDVLPVTLENELERNEVVDAHMRLWKSDGDHFTFLNIYNKWADAGQQEPSCSLFPLWLHRIYTELV